MRQKDSAAVRKKKRRISKAVAADPLGAHRLKPCAIKKVEKCATVSVKFNAKSLEGSGAASYVGRRQRTSRSSLSSVQQLRKEQIKINKWDGVYVCPVLLLMLVLTSDTARRRSYLIPPAEAW